MKKLILLLIGLFILGIGTTDYLDTIFNLITPWNYVKNVSTKNILQKSMAFTQTGNSTGGVVACINCSGLNMFKNLYLTNLDQDGQFNKLTIDSTGKIYKDVKAGGYAYRLTGNTTIATGNTRVPFAGTFQNDVLDSFYFSGDKIVYSGNTKAFTARFGASISSDTNINILSLGIKKNGVYLTGTKSSIKLNNTTDVLYVLTISYEVLNNGDSIQLVIMSDKAGVVVYPTSANAIISSFY